MWVRTWGVVLGTVLVAPCILAGPAGVPAPPPPVTCTTSAECPVCQVCTDGLCAYMTGLAGCFCDLDCEEAGLGTCFIDEAKPLCGGVCRDEGATQQNACGSVPDTLTLEPVELAIQIGADGAQPTSAQLRTLTLAESGMPNSSPALSSPNAGCALHAVRRGKGSATLALALAMLALAQRRRMSARADPRRKLEPAHGGRLVTILLTLVLIGCGQEPMAGAEGAIESPSTVTASSASDVPTSDAVVVSASTEPTSGAVVLSASTESTASALVEPLTDDCRARCRSLEVVGAPLELLPTPGEMVTALAYDDESWLVAWGGRPESRTSVQRIGMDGVPMSPALSYPNSVPRGITRDAESIVVWGWYPPAYDVYGYRMVAARFDPNLELLDAGLITGPGDFQVGWSFRAVNGRHEYAFNAGRVRWLRLEDATSMEVHNARRTEPPFDRVSAWAAMTHTGAGSEILWLGAEETRAVATVGTFGSEGIAMGESTEVFSYGAEALPVPSVVQMDNELMAMAADRGANPRVRLRRVDRTGTPTSDELQLTLPVGILPGVVNADDTPLILAYPNPTTVPFLPSLIPIDELSGAACRPITLEIAGSVQVQSIRSLVFEGTRGALTYGDGQSHLYFAQVECRQ